MTTHELRELFLKEHKRDRRLTFINYCIIALIVLTVLGLFSFILKSANVGIFETLSEAFAGGENDPAYARYIFIAVLIGCVLYPFYHVWKLSRRPQKIEELLKKIEAGGKANEIQDFKEYKVTVPLLKINLKLCPVTCALIYMADGSTYQLPINNFYLADMKILLSGGNVEKLNEIRAELYADTADDEDTDSPVREKIIDETPTPLKPVEEFRAFLNENLKGTIDTIEKQRKTTRNLTMIITPLVIIAVLGIAGYMYYSSYSAAAAGDYSGGFSNNKIIFFFAGICIVGFIYSYFMRWKHKQNTGAGQAVTAGMTPTTGAGFNEMVFGKIIKFINPTVEYMPLGHVGIPEFLESGFFVEKNYSIDGNDQISGRHNGVPFIMCELWVTHKRNFSDEKDSPDSVFSGQFFVAKFNKTFSSPVFIKPKKGWKGALSTDGASNYTYTVGDKIKLEDPEFMEMFEVYGTDQVEARYILTPALMERIKNIAKRTKGQYYIAFSNNKITIYNNNNSTKFGVGFFSSLTKDDNKLLVDFYESICDQFAIIDDLKLNVKIWK